jgi:hypothetical protein
MDVHGPSQYNDGSFMLSLAMNAGHCPGCGEAREPGTCDSCGAEVPAAEEASELAIARRAALASLLARAEDLWRECDVERPSGARITGEQLAGAIVQSKLFDVVDDADLSCQRLSALDFNDSEALGGTVREAIATELDLVERLRGLSLELAAFDAVPAQPELRGELIAAGARGVEMLLRLLEAVSAPTIEEVREAEGRLQEAIHRSSAYADLHERVEALLGSLDLDARIELVTGRPGPYREESGFVSPGLVFGAFAGEEGVYEQMADAATAYLHHLLPGELEPAAGAILILPAVSLASVDRPLLAQRCAAAMAELVNGAVALDRDAAAAVLDRNAREGPKLFAAASRVQAGMRLIRHASGLEGIEEQLILREVMNAYLEIAESAFRSYGWAVLQMQAVLAGESLGQEEPPMLGSLLQRLRASGSELARSLGEAADVDLRNAAGHAQYRWDSETQEVEDLEKGLRWNLAELEERTEALGDSVVGVDAGYMCAALAADIEIDASAATSDPGIREQLVEASFALAGCELTGLSPDGATVTVRASSEISLASLMRAVASLAALVEAEEAFRVLDADSGKALLDVPAERMMAATRGPEETRDLQVVQCFAESQTRTGVPASQAGRDGFVLQAKSVAWSAVNALATGGPEEPVVVGIRTRAEVVLDFLARHPEIDPQVAKAGRRRLERIVACSYSLQRDEPNALKELLRRLRATFIWAEQQGVVWPPDAAVEAA